MDANIQEFRKLGTSTVSDAMDRLGIIGQPLGIMPLDRSFRLCGRAFTVRTVPVDVVKGSVGDYIDDVSEGEVVVLDNAGLLDRTVWGDILTIMAHRRKVGGTVIHGICRDVDRSLELNYPIFSRGNWMRTGKDRVQADGYNVPCSLGEIRVNPGDLLLGDGDGIVVVAQQHEETILKAAKEIDDAEERIRKAIAEGASLIEARTKMGYHQLQSRQ
jgi:4-hydroxy-4-methyl-2-oxoglutarate aldolase